MEKHEQFKDDEGLWSLAMSAQMAEFREKNNLLDSYDEGLEEGTRIGIEKGTQIGLEKGTQIGLEKGTQIGLEKGTKIGLEKGTQIGLEKGTAIGTINLLATLIQQKYKIDAKEWLSTLSLEQLYELSGNILTCHSFEELQQTLNK